jgi:predicted phage terminase large subunit-like protein
MLKEKETTQGLPTKDLVDTALAELKLIEFVKQGWDVLEPATPFKLGWHLEAICDHLQAVADNQIKNLIINIPPRYMKSLSVSVFFPCWLWTTRPSLRYLFSSYSSDLSLRDSVKSRRLIQSLWYQARWGGTFQLTSDQNQKTRFDNDKMGYRFSTSVGGLATGEGGDYIIVDDPHNVKQTESAVQRKTALDWWFETMSTRVNDPESCHKIVVMQRLHENDLTGAILERDLGYEHLCLPAEFEKDRKCKTIIFEDPRVTDREVLWPAKYPRKALGIIKKELGSKINEKTGRTIIESYAEAGQMQQRPAPRGGGMFEVNQFRIIKNMIGTPLQGIRYWDKAGTEDGGKRTAGVLMYLMSDGSFCVTDVVCGQWEASNREKRIKLIAEMDGNEISVYCEQEPGSGGKESAQNTVKNLAGYMVRADKVTGAKEVRAEPYSCQVNIGNIYVLKRDWTRLFVDEHANFPVGKFSDQVDAASGAFNKLNFAGGRAGVI